MSKSINIILHKPRGIHVLFICQFLNYFPHELYEILFMVIGCSVFYFMYKDTLKRIVMRIKSRAMRAISKGPTFIKCMLNDNCYDDIRYPINCP